MRDAQRPGKEIPGITVYDASLCCMFVIASCKYSNLVGGASGPSNAECIAIIEKMS